MVNQAEADRDIPKLLAVPAAKRFLSIEPMLGPIDLTNTHMPGSGHGHHEFSPILIGNALRPGESRNEWGFKRERPGLDWVICGSESGHGARVCDVEWVRSLRDQCQAAGVAFFWKQHVINGKKLPLPELDGKSWAEFPT